MYFLLPAYADSHARLPKSYGGQGVLPVVECVAGIRRSLATRNEGGYASTPACQSTLYGGQGFRPTKNLEAPWASPVGLHKFCFASQKTYVNTLNELIYS